MGNDKRRPVSRWRRMQHILATGALVILTGCSTAAANKDSSPVASDTSSSTSFCNFLSQVSAVSNKATPADGLKLLKELQPQINAQVNSVPSTIAPYFKIIEKATQDALQHDTLSPLATDSVAQAGAKLSRYCHQRE